MTMEPRIGIYILASASDPRWNNTGVVYVPPQGRMPVEASIFVIEKKNELGIDPPSDIVWQYNPD